MLIIISIFLFQYFLSCYNDEYLGFGHQQRNLITASSSIKNEGIHIN